jgi:hypothetical protein
MLQCLYAVVRLADFAYVDGGFQLFYCSIVQLLIADHRPSIVHCLPA